MKTPDITPGPWTVTDSYTALFHNDLREEEVYEVNAVEAGNSPAYATSEAHAQAIAALPDLLKACEFFAKYAGMQMSKGKPLPSQLTGTLYSAMEKAGYTF